MSTQEQELVEYRVDLLDEEEEVRVFGKRSPNDNTCQGLRAVYESGVLTQKLAKQIINQLENVPKGDTLELEDPETKGRLIMKRKI